MSANSVHPPRLFTVADSEVIKRFDAERLLERAGVRAGVVAVEFDALRSFRDESRDFEVALDLFPDIQVNALLHSVSPPSSGSQAWIGTIPDHEESTVSIVMREEGIVTEGATVSRRKVLVGTVRSSTLGLFQITPLPHSSLHLIRQIDESRFPPCATGAEQLPNVHRDALPRMVREDGSRIDVLVVYTPAARDGAGGHDAIRATIDLAVIETNEAYRRSNVAHRLRLVYMGQIDYDEAGADDFYEMLSDLRIEGNGQMDDVHSLRDFYGADLVALIVERSEYCGVAYIMPSASPSFEKYAFSITARICATGHYSFAHELGHNMGCCHDIDNADGSCIYDYSYGWRFRVNHVQYRTIMAYSPGIRVQNFSNPNVWFQGVRTGRPSEADNARTMLNTAETVANFRKAQNPVLGLILSPTSIDFGPLPVGDIRTRQLSITNYTESDVTISVPAKPPPFSCPPVNTVLAHGAVRHVIVEFIPGAPGPHQDTLEITSSASSQPHRIKLGGQGVTGPPL